MFLSCSAQVQEGEASYYKNVFEGKTTASGEIFRQNLFTAAHRQLEFGTIVKVTNKKNGKSANVRINDRGPYIRNRIIDVSKSVAQYLGFIDSGKALVTIEIIGFSNENPPNIYTYPTTPTQEVANSEVVQEVENRTSIYKVPKNEESEKSVEVDEQSSAIKITEVVSKPKVEPEIKQEKEAVNSLENNQANLAQTNKAASSKDDENKIHAEVVDIVKQVASASEDKNKSTKEEVIEIKPKQPNQINQNLKSISSEKDKVESALLSVEMNPAALKKKLDEFLEDKELKEQLFDLNANPISGGFYAVQVSTLSDAVSAFELSKIVADFYQEEVSVVYKATGVNPLYSTAVAKLQTRAQAETLLEKIKARYPYAFILNLSN